MADAVIDIVGQDELPLIVDLFNQIFRPTRDIDSFRRRYLGRYNVLQMVARIDGEPVGFFVGFEQKPSVFFGWFYGVLPDYRRQGVTSQLMEAAQEWSKDHGYERIRLECHNRHRPLLRLAIDQGYNIVGVRWDADRGDNLVLFEKELGDETES